MNKEKSIKKLLIFLIVLSGLIFISPDFNSFIDLKSKLFVKADISQTTVVVHVCGNGLTEGSEFCDDGSNNGRYAYNAADRFCNTNCSGWAAYCGNGILELAYGEQCDDGNNQNGDGCSAICQTEAAPPQPPGGGGGGAALPPVTTAVIMKGKAYPGSEIHILKDGREITTARANAQADFTTEISNISAGVYTFSLWAEDKDGIKSITYSLTFRVTENTITTVSGIFLPPTISLNKSSLRQGDILNIFGQTVPKVEVEVVIQSPLEIVKKIQSDEIGAWLLPFNTSPLEYGSHLTKAQFQLNGQEKSGYGRALTFNIGEKTIAYEDVCGKADFNKDNRVNLVDFSIFLCWWGKSNPEIDLNQSGKVDLADFSIFLCCWTG